MNIEIEYRTRVDAMSVAERIRRTEVLFNWSRDYLVRSIVSARGEMSDDDLKLEVALRQYGADPATRELIDELVTVRRTAEDMSLTELLDEVLAEQGEIDV